jgi:hypothetical protein
MSGGTADGIPKLRIAAGTSIHGHRLRPEAGRVLRKRPSFRTRMTPTRLIFVYNADNGFFNALMDSAHKVFSPATYQCSLCKFTYGLAGMLLPWKNFLEALKIPVVFLHRREFRRENPGAEPALPVMLFEHAGQSEVLLSAEEINEAGSLEGLIGLTRDRLAEIANRPERI